MAASSVSDQPQRARAIVTGGLQSFTRKPQRHPKTDQRHGDEHGAKGSATVAAKENAEEYVQRRTCTKCRQREQEPQSRRQLVSSENVPTYQCRGISAVPVYSLTTKHVSANAESKNIQAANARSVAREIASDAEGGEAESRRRREGFVVALSFVVSSITPLYSAAGSVVQEFGEVVLVAVRHGNHLRVDICRRGNWPGWPPICLSRLREVHQLRLQGPSDKSLRRFRPAPS